MVWDKLYHYFSNFQNFSDPEAKLFPPIYERRLAYTPNNDVFKKIVDRASELLELKVPALGVVDGNQLERNVVDKGLVAGIQFHHANVSPLS